MENLTTKQIEDIVDDLRNFDFLPIGREGRKPYEQICKGAEQMRDELLDYKHLEEEIECPFKVRCNIIDGGFVYNEKRIGIRVEMVFENYFVGWNPLTDKTGYYYYKDYKKTFWLKEDKSE